MVTMLKRAYNHPAWIPVLSGIAFIALVGTMVLFGMFVIDQRAERLDRVEDQLAACERGNVLREQIVDIGDAGAQLDRTILATVFRGMDEDRRNALLADIEPAFVTYDAELSEIVLIDCEAAIKGN